MEQSPTWQANRSSASEEETRILGNPKDYYPIYKNRPPVLNLSQKNPIHVPHPTSWTNIFILTSHLFLGVPSGLLPSCVTITILYATLLSTIRTTRPAHLNSSWIDHPKNIWRGVQTIYASVATTHFLDPNILLSTLLSNTLSLRSSLSVSGQVSHPQKITAKLEFCVLIINSSLISKHVAR